MFKKIFVYLPLVVFSLVCLYFIFTTSYYVRYWVDDFCSAVFLRTNGFIGAQIGWWKSWTGRYSAVFFTDLFELVGPWVVRLLPVVLFISLFLSSFDIFFKNIIFSLVFVLLVLVNAPNIIQSFYWQTGSLNYFIPFVFLGVFLSLLVRDRDKKNLFMPFILMFIAGGFSESFALSALVFNFFLILAIYFIKPKNFKSKLIFAFFGLLGILVSLLAMSLSPGNEARSLTVTKPESLVFVIKSSILATKWYLLRMLNLNSFIYSLLIIFSLTFLLVPRIKLDLKRATVLIFIDLSNLVLTTMAVMFSGFYSMSIIPPERALFIVFYFTLLSFYFIFLCLFALFNFYFPSYLRRISFLFIFLNIFATFFLLKEVKPYWSNILSEVKNYAESWDKETRNLPRIKNIKPVGGLDSFTDNKGWVSSCVASYYGFEKLEIVESR